MDTQTQRYEKLLEQFTLLCEDHVRRGFPYLAIMLCHELYRYLYPVEPYANFVNRDPVTFSLNHISQLIILGETFNKTTTPYNNVLTSFDLSLQHNEALEKETSNLYSELWKDFDDSTLTEESYTLLTKRLPAELIEKSVVGRTILDMGCGSGRYTLALAKAGAAKVVGIDVQSKSYATAKKLAQEKNLPVEFREANVHDLPFEDESFDFVFSNGVLHHSSSIEKGVSELARVLKTSCSAFLYLYAAGGFFWNTRISMRRIFRNIPLAYTKAVLSLMGMPSNRFIFCDTWYVPVETLTTKQEMEAILNKAGVTYQKIFGQAEFDLDKAIADDIPGAEIVWGDGEHRYILTKTKH